MSNVTQVGTTPEGFPNYRRAPEPATVPARFWFDGSWIKCGRDGCTWDHCTDREALTEIVAVAREHLEEAHRG
ncbi:hypothetical protein [Streptomyces sp. NPDC006739]|uniref:hypothetical protein n=1 Tax=Streptomyces sp. NPDC006739 TaxID=3364763 RepID=UPI0036915588